MLVLIMGHRLPLARCLEKLKIPYIIWTEKAVVNELSATQIITQDFPEFREDVSEQIPNFIEITHVIAAVEKSVIPASNIRLWFKLKRNPHNLILKCTDKYKMKSYLSEKNIPMTDFCSTKKITNEEVIEKIGFPIVSKPRLSSGGRGILFLNSSKDLVEHKSSDYYYEKAIKGNEGSIESFIQNNEIVFSNITEYFKPGFCNKIPGRYSEEIKQQITKLNRDVIKALNIKWGMTHLEYYLTDSGILFGEVALRPPGGYIMDIMSMAYDFDAWELFVKIELNIFEERSFNLEKYGSSVLIHPGVGVVEKIEGEEEIKNLASLKKFKLNIKKGDQISNREGVGQNTGHLYLSHNSSKQIDKDIDRFYKEFKIQLK